ncbi:MAG: biopolymer transporter ExbD [Bdellovibrionales bacterium]
MANIEESGSSSRQIAIEPNIVPFIDLMSVLIIFLLITAVWTQVSMIQIGSSVYGKKQDEQEVQVPPKADIAFRLDVLTNGYRVLVGTKTINFPKVGAEYDFKTLVNYLKEVKQTYPEKNDAIVTIMDELPYGDLIKGMDALLVAGFPQIAVATSGVE